ncbi:MAG: MSMEG_0570 family nitrogen starvation response protein [Piscinibacter sp.]
MPEMHYRLRWPDDSVSTCYSPSRVIKDHFEEGGSYPMADFLARARTATQLASERVAAKYGFACSRAADQLGAIEAVAERFAQWPQARVQMIEFLE